MSPTLLEQDARTICLDRIRTYQLPMKIVGVSVPADLTHIVFEFTSADRVDFRQLVKDLARHFHKRIEMRQMGVRDAAKSIGGIGSCGRQTCCSTFLTEFQPVSIRMAKDQNLSLNQQKLSGICGRLRCCLLYEQGTYAQARETLPKLGKRVMTPEGEGRVKDVNVLKQRVRVEFPERRFVEFDAKDVQRINAPAQHSEQTHAPKTPHGES